MAVGTEAHDEEERREAERHDRLYHDRRPANLVMDPDDWERFSSLRNPIDAYQASVHELGDIRGKQVLDMGCGDGWLSVILAKRGGVISGYDISPGAIDIAKQRAEQNKVVGLTHFKVASAYATEYPDGHFDVAIGQAILHHLGDKDQLATELRRILKPGAKAVFCEPFAAVPWMRRVRRLVPVRSEAEDDPDQQQMTYADFEPFAKHFDVEIREYQLFSRLDRILKFRAAIKALGHFDRHLLRLAPFLRKYARTAVVVLRSRAV